MSKPMTPDTDSVVRELRASKDAVELLLTCGPTSGKPELAYVLGRAISRLCLLDVQFARTVEMVKSAIDAPPGAAPVMTMHDPHAAIGLVGKIEHLRQELAKARAERDEARSDFDSFAEHHKATEAAYTEARAEIARLEDRLQIDPGGSDKIDELTEALMYSRHAAEQREQALRDEVARLKQPTLRECTGLSGRHNWRASTTEEGVLRCYLCGASQPAQGSCLICGQWRPYAVYHESGAAGVCESCRNAPNALQALRDGLREEQLESFEAGFDAGVGAIDRYGEQHLSADVALEQFAAQLDALLTVPAATKCWRCGGSGYHEVGSGKGGCACPECLGTGTAPAAPSEDERDRLEAARARAFALHIPNADASHPPAAPAGPQEPEADVKAYRHAIAQDASERVCKNANPVRGAGLTPLVPQLCFAPILFALDDADVRPPRAATPVATPSPSPSAGEGVDDERAAIS